MRKVWLILALVVLTANTLWADEVRITGLLEGPDQYSPGSYTVHFPAETNIVPRDRVRFVRDNVVLSEGVVTHVDSDSTSVRPTDTTVHPHAGDTVVYLGRPTAH